MHTVLQKRKIMQYMNASDCLISLCEEIVSLSENVNRDYNCVGTILSPTYDCFQVCDDNST